MDPPGEARSPREDGMASARRYRALVEHASELMLVWDADGAPIYASPATIRFAVGDGLVDASDGIATRHSDIHPDDRGAVARAVASLNGRPGADTKFAARYLRHDGVYRWLAVTVTNRLDDPAVRGTIAHSRDITEQLESAEALREAEVHMRTLLRYSSDVLAVIGPDGVLLRPTPNGILGYPNEALVGQNVFDIVHPDDRPGVQEVLARSLEQPEEPIATSARIRHFEGNWQQFDIVMTNCIGQSAVGGIVVNGHDVTGRSEAEGALQASDQFSRTVIESLTGPVVVLDETGVIVRDNRDWREFIALSGGDPASYGLGTNYLEICEQGVDAGMAGSAEMAAGVHAVLSGATQSFSMEYSPPGPGNRWYELHVAPLGEGMGGVVVHQVDATERKGYERQLAEAALHDALTRLPNRALLADRLETAFKRNSRSPDRVGLLFFDIDHFKVLNDGRGHVVGDRLLVSLARRLEGLVRPGDTVARFGGDEFVVLCENVDGAHELQVIAERLVDGLADPFDVGSGEHIVVTVSVGIALGDDDADGDTLLRDADAAMYMAKERGRNRWEFFGQDLRAKVMARLSTETQLRRALERDELRVWYQPIVALGTGEIVGAEALVRWQHPERGLVGPDEFIPVAEETGLIVPIGSWVLQQACAQARRWHEARAGRALSLSVNLAATQLARSDLVQEVAGAIADAGITGDRLTFELTETALIDTRHAPVETLRGLRDLGIRIALDDFGTGYSSLSYLKRFPIQTIKIDRSFIMGLGRDPDDAAIVSATLAIADTLGLDVVAEGIETEVQRSVLAEQNCGYGQGFLFGAAMPAELLTERLRVAPGSLAVTSR